MITRPPGAVITAAMVSLAPGPVKAPAALDTGSAPSFLSFIAAELRLGGQLTTDSFPPTPGS